MSVVKLNRRVVLSLMGSSYAVSASRCHFVASGLKISHKARAITGTGVNQFHFQIALASIVRQSRGMAV